MNSILIVLPSTLALLYAVLMIVGYIPGISGMLKSKDVKGVSDNFWFLITVTVTIIFHNLLLSEVPTQQIIAVGLNLLFAIICLLLYEYKKSGFSGIFLTVFFMLVIYYGLMITKSNINLTQTVAHVTIILAYAGQIYRLYAVRSTEGLNKNLFFIMGTGMACLIISLLMTGAPLQVILTEFINLVLVVICYVKIKSIEKG